MNLSLTTHNRSQWRRNPSQTWIASNTSRIFWFLVTMVTEVTVLHCDM